MIFPRRIWKDIQGYEGLYQVSKLGEVRSLNYKGFTGKIQNLTLTLRKDGYLRVNLIKNGKKKQYAVHRLVAQAFLENPNKYNIVNHKDLNRSNNLFTNLEWVTQKENMNYSLTVEKRKQLIEKKYKDILENEINVIKLILNLFNYEDYFINLNEYELIIMLRYLNLYFENAILPKDLFYYLLDYSRDLYYKKLKNNEKIIFDKYVTFRIH